MTDVDNQLVVNAERAVLGIALWGGVEALKDAGLNGSHFRVQQHADIYAHLVSMWATEEPIEPLLVGKRLDAAGELKRLGGLNFIHDLYQAAPLRGEASHFVEIITNAHEQRDLLVEAAELSQAGSIADRDARRAKVEEIRARHTARASTGADSWTPVDLEPYLDGTYERPEPTVGLARRDGLRFLYPGKEHAVVGEMESGKSWFSLACVAAELGAGKVVVYVHFEEDDPADTVERLQILGVTRAQLRHGFRFVGPSQPATAERISRLLACQPALVVLDGQNEGMALHAQAIREEDGAAAFRKLLVKPWTAAGAAVLSCDHVVKDREARGRYALGSVHKGNALNGSLIVLENSEPFGRGERGVSRVYVTKDRPGHLRRHGQGTKTPGKTYMGTLVVDDTRRWVDGLELMFWPPSEDKPADKPDNKLAEWVLDVIAKQPEQAVSSSRALYALLRKEKITARNTAVNDAVDDLMAAGHIVETTGSRGAKGYRLTASQDQQELPL